MANNNTNLDAGFEEVTLDSGFEEIPLEVKKKVPSNELPTNSQGGGVQSNVATNPIVHISDIPKKAEPNEQKQAELGAKLQKAKVDYLGEDIKSLPQEQGGAIIDAVNWGKETLKGIGESVDNLVRGVGLEKYLPLEVKALVSRTPEERKKAKDYHELSSEKAKIDNVIKDAKVFIPEVEKKLGKSIVDMTPKEFADSKRKIVDTDYKVEDFGIDAAEYKKTQNDYASYGSALANKIGYNHNQLKAEGFFDNREKIAKDVEAINAVYEVKKKQYETNPSNVLANELNAIGAQINAKQEEFKALNNDPRVQEMIKLDGRAKKLQEEFTKNVKTVDDKYLVNQDKDDKSFEKMDDYGLMTNLPIKSTAIVANNIGKAINKMMVGLAKMPKNIGDAITSKELPQALGGNIDDFLYDWGTSQEMRGEARYNDPTKLKRNIAQKYTDYNGYRLLLDDEGKPYSVRSTDFGAINSMDGGKAVMDAYEKETNPDYGKRNDGTAKANGYFGALPMKDGSGDVATEISVGVNIGGKEVEIPTLVPTLTEKEKDFLLTNGSNRDIPIPESIMAKAVEHAKKRIKEGKSPFASNEDRFPIKTDFSGTALFSQGTSVLADIGMMALTGRVGGVVGKSSRGLVGEAIGSKRIKDAVGGSISGTTSIYAQVYGDFYNQVAQDENLTESQKHRYAMLNGMAVATIAQKFGDFEQKLMGNPNLRASVVKEISKYQQQLLSGELSSFQVAAKVAKAMGKDIGSEVVEETGLEPAEQHAIDIGFNRSLGTNLYNVPSAEEQKNTVIATVVATLPAAIQANYKTKNRLNEETIAQMSDILDGKNYATIDEYYNDLRNFKRSEGSDMMISAIKDAEKIGKGDDLELKDLFFRAKSLEVSAEKETNRTLKAKSLRELKEVEQAINDKLDGKPIEFYINKDKPEPTSEEEVAEPTNENAQTEEVKVEEVQPEETPKVEPLNEPIDIQKVVESLPIFERISSDQEAIGQLKDIVSKVANGEELTEKEQNASEKLGIEKAISEFKSNKEANTKAKVEEIAPIELSKEVEEPKVDISKVTTLEDLVDEKVDYNGERGILRQDEGGKLTFETPNKIVEVSQEELPNVVLVAKPIVKGNNVSIGDENFGFVSLNKDNSGNVVSITLTKNGKQITKRDTDLALDVAEQLSSQAFNERHKNTDAEELHKVIAPIIKVEFQKEFSGVASELLDNLPDEVENTLTAFRNGVVAIAPNELQLMVVNTSQWIDDTKQKVRDSRGTKKEKAQVIQSLDNLQKQLNKYYGQIEKQRVAQNKDATKGKASEANGKVEQSNTTKKINPNGQTNSKGLDENKQPTSEGTSEVVGKTDADKKVKEIQSKKLTHVKGLKMRGDQARGMYISTEDVNRYETDDNKADEVEVDIKNPLVVDKDLALIGYRTEVLNENRDKFEREDSADFGELPKGKLSLDDLNDSGIRKLARLTTEKLQKEGYDAIYFPQNNAQEGELIVFDRDKVSVKNTPSQKEWEKQKSNVDKLQKKWVNAKKSEKQVFLDEYNKQNSILNAMEKAIGGKLNDYQNSLQNKKNKEAEARKKRPKADGKYKEILQKAKQYFFGDVEAAALDFFLNKGKITAESYSSSGSNAKGSKEYNQLAFLFFNPKGTRVDKYVKSLMDNNELFGDEKELTEAFIKVLDNYPTLRKLEEALKEKIALFEDNMNADEQMNYAEEEAIRIEDENGWAYPELTEEEYQEIKKLFINENTNERSISNGTSDSKKEKREVNGDESKGKSRISEISQRIKELNSEIAKLRTKIENGENKLKNELKKDELDLFKKPLGKELELFNGNAERNTNIENAKKELKAKEKELSQQQALLEELENGEKNEKIDFGNKIPKEVPLYTKGDNVTYRGIDKRGFGGEGSGIAGLGKGLYTTNSMQEAEKYAWEDARTKGIPKAFINAKPTNPLVLKKGTVGDWVKLNIPKSKYKTESDFRDNMSDYLTELGYDGVTIKSEDGVEIYVKYAESKPQEQAKPTKEPTSEQKEQGKAISKILGNLYKGVKQIITSPTEVKAILDKLGYGSIQEMVEAYHGSPHSFDKFSTKKIISSGDFGYGLYFAAKKSTAEIYSKMTKTKKEKAFIYKVFLHNRKDVGEYEWIDWGKPLTIKQKNKILNQLKKEGLDKTKEYYLIKDGINMKGREVYKTLADIKYNKLSLIEKIKSSIFYDYGYQDGKKEASNFLLRAKIDGIIAEPLDKSDIYYVVFDENAVTIDEKIQFLKTPKGEVYGFTYYENGKPVIVMDETLMNPNTPIHEYGHLFVDYFSESGTLSNFNSQNNTINNQNYLLSLQYGYAIDRLSPEEEQGRNLASQTNVRATHVAERSHRSNANGGKNKEIKRHEESELKKDAKENGYWLDTSNYGDPHQHGAESDVFVSEDGNFVTKITDGAIHYNNWLDFFDHIALHNANFPDTKYVLKGFTEYKGAFSAVLEQQFIKDARDATRLEIVENMSKMGFTSIGLGVFVNKKTGIYVGDLIEGNGNALHSNGHIFFIDPVIKPNFSFLGLGGNRKKIELSTTTDVARVAKINNTNEQQQVLGWAKIIWDAMSQVVQKDFEENGEKSYLGQVKSNPAYAEKSEKEQIKEALATAIGDEGEKLTNEAEKSIFKQAYEKFFELLGKLFGIEGKTPQEIAKMKINELAKNMAVDLLTGKAKIREVDTKEINLRNIFDYLDESNFTYDKKESEQPKEKTDKEVKKETRKLVRDFESDIKTIGVNPEKSTRVGYVTREGKGVTIDEDAEKQIEKFVQELYFDDAKLVLDSIKQEYGKEYLQKSFDLFSKLTEKGIEANKLHAFGIAIENEINDILKGNISNDYSIERDNLIKVFKQIQKMNAQTATDASKVLNATKNLYRDKKEDFSETILTNEEIEAKKELLKAISNDTHLDEAIEEFENGDVFEEPIAENPNLKEKEPLKYDEKIAKSVFQRAKDLLNKIICK